MRSVAQNIGEEGGLRVAVVTSEICGTNRDDNVLKIREAVEVLEKLNGFVARESLGVFRKRLRGDAQSLHGVAAGFENELRALEEFDGVRDVDLVAGAVEINESGDGANSWLGRFGRLLRHSECAGAAEKREDETMKIPLQSFFHKVHMNAEIPVIFSPMMSL